MPRAYCSNCKELVEVVAGNPNGRGRQRDWIPLPHSPCNSTKPAGDAKFEVDHDVQPVEPSGVPGEGFRWRN